MNTIDKLIGLITPYFTPIVAAVEETSSNWFHNMSRHDQLEFLREFPDSKYSAKSVEDDNTSHPPKLRTKGRMKTKGEVRQARRERENLDTMPAPLFKGKWAYKNDQIDRENEAWRAERRAATRDSELPSAPSDAHGHPGKGKGRSLSPLGSDPRPYPSSKGKVRLPEETPDKYADFVKKNRKWKKVKGKYVTTSAFEADLPTQVETAGYAIDTVPEKGKGMIARQDYAAGDTIVVGSMLVLPENDGITTASASKLHEYLWMWPFDKDGAPDPAGRAVAMLLGDGNMLNHTETPNCDFYLNGPERTHTIVAAEDIKAGDELTIDYGWYESKAQYDAFFATQKV